MKKRIQEPVTIANPPRALPPIVVTLTKRDLLRKTCGREDWHDDGYVARCVLPPNHRTPCSFGVYMKANEHVMVTVSRRPKGEA